MRKNNFILMSFALVAGAILTLALVFSFGGNTSQAPSFHSVHHDLEQSLLITESFASESESLREIKKSLDNNLDLIDYRGTRLSQNTILKIDVLSRLVRLELINLNFYKSRLQNVQPDHPYYNLTTQILNNQTQISADNIALIFTEINTLVSGYTKLRSSMPNNMGEQGSHIEHTYQSIQPAKNQNQSTNSNSGNLENITNLSDITELEEVIDLEEILEITELAEIGEIALLA
ncbi:MAG: hypothetical protein FWB72_04990 [Firmicutes bacterium]|nr:hypothetical protein [Bacillota bacterium]